VEEKIEDEERYHHGLVTDLGGQKLIRRNLAFRLYRSSIDKYHPSLVWRRKANGQVSVTQVSLQLESTT